MVLSIVNYSVAVVNRITIVPLQMLHLVEQ